MDDIKYYVIQEDKATNPLAGPKFYSFDFDNPNGTTISLTDFTMATRWTPESGVVSYAKTYLSNYKILEVQIKEIK